jgi:hypothetical protein
MKNHEAGASRSGATHQGFEKRVVWLIESSLLRAERQRLAHDERRKFSYENRNRNITEINVFRGKRVVDFKMTDGAKQRLG